jgi:Spy/CpxP family protein refolding chaperone
MLVALLSLVLSLANAQTGGSPFAGQETLEIKALSPADVQAYLAGEGMGLARAAELNHYPGPRHVLELAQELDLSPEQAEQTRGIHARMKAEAVRLGKLNVEKERLLDRLFVEQKVEDEQLRALVAEIGRLQGELRFVHLRAHLAMRELLRREQIARYDELRGYTAGRGVTHRH